MSSVFLYSTLAGKNITTSDIKKILEGCNVDMNLVKTGYYYRNPESDTYSKSVYAFMTSEQKNEVFEKTKEFLEKNSEEGVNIANLWKPHRNKGRHQNAFFVSVSVDLANAKEVKKRIEEDLSPFVPLVGNFKVTQRDDSDSKLMFEIQNENEEFDESNTNIVDPNATPPLCYRNPMDSVRSFLNCDAKRRHNLIMRRLGMETDNEDHLKKPLKCENIPLQYKEFMTSEQLKEKSRMRYENRGGFRGGRGGFRGGRGGFSQSREEIKFSTKGSSITRKSRPTEERKEVYDEVESDEEKKSIKKKVSSTKKKVSKRGEDEE